MPRDRPVTEVRAGVTVLPRDASTQDSIAACGAGEGTHAVVLDSVGSFVAREQVPELCAGMRQLARARPVRRVLAVVHDQLYPDGVLPEALDYVASTSIWLQPGQVARILHRRRTGKVLQETVAYELGADGSLARSQPVSSAQPSAEDPAAGPDPAHLTTFNLGQTAQSQRVRQVGQGYKRRMKKEEEEE